MGFQNVITIPLCDFSLPPLFPGLQNGDKGGTLKDLSPRHLPFRLLGCVPEMPCGANLSAPCIFNRGDLHLQNDHSEERHHAAVSKAWLLGHRPQPLPTAEWDQNCRSRALNCQEQMESPSFSPAWVVMSTP